jgi:hypothetical protein
MPISADRRSQRVVQDYGQYRELLAHTSSDAVDGAPVGTTLAQARESFERGDFAGARALFEVAVEGERSAEALDGLGESMWFLCGSMRASRGARRRTPITTASPGLAIWPATSPSRPVQAGRRWWPRSGTRELAVLPASRRAPPTGPIGLLSPDQPLQGRIALPVRRAAA